MTPYSRNPGYWLQRRAQRRSGYPAATLAFYGPNDSGASKAVIGIILSEQASDDVAELKKWFSETADLRTDPETIEEMLLFMDERNVQRLVIADGIIGCPHEEGIDYPEGESCPQCPFWADRDRWTGERLI